MGPVRRFEQKIEHADAKYHRIEEIHPEMTEHREHAKNKSMVQSSGQVGAESVVRVCTENHPIPPDLQSRNRWLAQADSLTLVIL